MGAGGRDNLSRIDAELLASGVRPGDPSLYRAPDEDTAEDSFDVSAGPGHHDHAHDHDHQDHDHTHHDHQGHDHTHQHEH